jgi:hypothetical protein
VEICSAQSRRRSVTAAVIWAMARRVFSRRRDPWACLRSRCNQAGAQPPRRAGALPPGAVAAAAQAVANDPESRAAQSWRSVSAPNRSLFT